MGPDHIKKGALVGGDGKRVQQAFLLPLENLERTINALSFNNLCAHHGKTETAKQDHRQMNHMPY
jgi:hypothetical protein